MHRYIDAYVEDVDQLLETRKWKLVHDVMVQGAVETDGEAEGKLASTIDKDGVIAVPKGAK